MGAMTTARCSTPGCTGLVLKLKGALGSICHDRCMECRAGTKEKTNGTDSAPAPV
jgi:hypothetical protein